MNLPPISRQAATVKYVNPEKVYVIMRGGVPVRAVPSKDLAEMWANVERGHYVLVPYYSKTDFHRDFADEKPVVYDQYISSWTNPGENIYAPVRKYRF